MRTEIWSVDLAARRPVVTYTGAVCLEEWWQTTGWEKWVEMNRLSRMPTQGIFSCKNGIRERMAGSKGSRVRRRLCFLLLFCLLLFFFFKRESTCEQGRGRGRETEKQRLSSRLHSQCRAEGRAPSHYPGIMT